jgi:WD40 repeat protein/serine/threonine protein kinase
LRQLLTEELEGDARAAVEGHLESCGLCQEALQRLMDEDAAVLKSHRRSGQAAAADPPLSARDEDALAALKNAPPTLTLGRRRGEAEAPPVVPGYEILGPLGQGAVGVVYKARHVVLNRLVALKMIHQAVPAGAEELARFRIEGELVARLDHPHIVHIHEVGTPAGRMFLALEYVDGGSLAEKLEGTPQPPQAAAELVEVLAQAIHAAHLQGIVHRDLKPANILLATPARSASEGRDRSLAGASGLSETPARSASEGRNRSLAGASGWCGPQGTESPGSSGRRVTAYGIPKIADFSLAKQLGGDSRLTRSGSVMGTPRYMAPEQCGGGREVGPAADLYALGTILYELLTGQVPFPAGDVVTVLKHLAEQEPPPPRRLCPAVPADLEVICLKCLRKEPRQRYASALDLAEDLRRWRTGEPIQARPVGRWERSWKWARRRPLVAALLLGLLAVSGLGAAGVTAAMLYAFAGWERAARQEQEAVAARDEARAARNAAQRQSARLVLDKGLSLAEQGDVARGLHFMRQALLVAPPDDAEVVRLARVNLAAWAEHVNGMRRILEHPENVASAAFSPDGKTLATGTLDGRLWRWEPATGRLLGPPAKARVPVSAVAFSPDGRVLVTGGGRWEAEAADADCAVEWWDARTGQPAGPALPHKRRVFALAFSPDGQTLATVAKDSVVRLWDAGTHALTSTWAPSGDGAAVGGLFSVVFSRDGRLLIAGGGDGTVRVWDRAAGRERHRLRAHAGVVHGVALHPEGKVLASAGQDGRLRLWHLETGTPAGEMLETDPDRLRAVAFTADGTTLLAGGEDGFGRLWDVATGRPLGTPLRHEAIVFGLAVHPDGQTLVTAGGDRTARLWEIGRSRCRPPAAPGSRTHLGLYPAGRIEPGAESSESRAEAPAPRRPRLVDRVVFAPGPKAALLLTSKGTALLCDLTGGRPAQPLAHPYERVRAAAFSPDGQVFATACHHNRTKETALRLWDVGGRPRTDWLDHRNWVAALAFTPDGTRLATADYSQCVELRETATGRPVGKPLVQREIAVSLAISPDGRRLAVGTAGDRSGDPHVRLWDLTTGTPLGEPLHFRHRVSRVAFSPDGQALLTRCYDFTARLWDVATGLPLCAPLLHARSLDDEALSPDGRLLVTAAGNGVVRLWSVPDGKPLGLPMHHPAEARRVAFAPDGKTLVVGCDDGSTRLWDVATNLPLGPPRTQGAPVWGVAFAPGGRAVYSVAQDATVWAWPVPAPLEADPDQLALWLEARTGLQLEAGGQAVQLLNAAQWRDRLRQLAERDRAGGRQAVPGLDVADWHEARARDAEQDGDAFAAAWHLDRLLARRPDDGLLRARRGDVHVTAGQFNEAAAAYRRAGELGPPDAVRAWLRWRQADCQLRGQTTAAAWYAQRLGTDRPGD